jgi:hypothetical protein
MKRIADEGDIRSHDDSCTVLYGIVRDCAYKIEARVGQERALHGVDSGLEPAKPA